MNNRTLIETEENFENILNKIINKIKVNKYDGDYTFVTFDYKAKIITKIEYNKKLLYIVIFLGGNEKLKEDISEIILI
jgi:hypothetical protein